METYFIELPKFNKVEEKNSKQDRLRRWVTFFNNDILEDKLSKLMKMDI